MKIAGAPISWGVCEVPGWGYQLSSDRVLAEMREAGLTATELGPEGFLPTDTDAAHHAAERIRPGLRGRVRPRGAVQGRPRSRSTISPDRWSRWWPPVPAWWCWPPPPGPTATTTGPCSTKASGPRCFPTWTGSPRSPRRGVCARCCTRTSERWWRTAPRSTACWPGRRIPLCLDTGHLLIGGTDPLALTRQVPDRIEHAHLKDVNAELAAKVQSGELTYTQAVAAGMYVPLGAGDVDIAGIVKTLEDNGYDGWYVMEQDNILDGEPEGAGSVGRRAGQRGVPAGRGVGVSS